MSEVGFATPLLWRRLGQVWLGLICFFGLSVFTSSWAAETCSDFKEPAEVRLASCTRAGWLGLPLLFLEPEEDMAHYWLAYGAARADVGQIDAGKEHFRRAFRAVRLYTPITLPDDLKHASYQAPYLLDFASQIPPGSAARQALLEVMVEGR